MTLIYKSHPLFIPHKWRREFGLPSELFVIVEAHFGSDFKWEDKGAIFTMDLNTSRLPREVFFGYVPLDILRKPFEYESVEDAVDDAIKIDEGLFLAMREAGYGDRIWNVARK